VTFAIVCCKTDGSFPLSEIRLGIGLELNAYKTQLDKLPNSFGAGIYRLEYTSTRTDLPRAVYTKNNASTAWAYDTPRLVQWDLCRSRFTLDVLAPYSNVKWHVISASG
jgi:hypothetical protein